MSINIKLKTSQILLEFFNMTLSVKKIIAGLAVLNVIALIYFLSLSTDTGNFNSTVKHGKAVFFLFKKLIYLR